jgi:hypothetical protein
MAAGEVSQHHGEMTEERQDVWGGEWAVVQEVWARVYDGSVLLIAKPSYAKYVELSPEARHLAQRLLELADEAV